MTALASYSTGTVSAATDGTAVTGTTTLWSTTGNVKPGDIFVSGHYAATITDVTDDTHLVITPWPGGTLSGASYKIWKVSPQRIVGESSASDVDELVSALRTLGFFVYVPAASSVPDPSLGEDGQYAFQPTTRKYWLHTGGAWVFQGQPGIGDLTSTAQTLTETQKAQARANIDVQKKNYIINGGMQVSQENGSTAGATSGYFPVDQFAVNFSNTATLSLAQVASVTPGNSPNRLRVTVSAADASVAGTDYAYILQPLEGQRIADLRFGYAVAKNVTMQFGVKAPAGTYCVVLCNHVVDRSYVAEYTIAPGEANTDVVKSVTIPVDQSGSWATSANGALFVKWGLMAGTSFQQAAGSWGSGNPVGSPSQFNLLGSNGNVFELFDVGLYDGTVAPAFQLPDIVTELVKCRRYYEKITWGAEFYASAGNQRYQSTIGFAPKRINGGYAVTRVQAPSTATNVRASDPATYARLGVITSAEAQASLTVESAAAGLVQAYTIIDAINARM